MADLIGAKELFRGSIVIFKSKWKVISLLNLTFAPLWVICFLAFGTVALEEKAQWPGGAVIGLAMVLLTILINLAILYVVSQKNSQVDYKQAIRFGAGIYLAGLWVAALTALTVLAGFVLFIIPGIIFSVWYSFSTFVLVTEQKKGWSALQRSKELVKGKWWAVAGRIGALALVMIIIMAILNSISSSLADIANVFILSPVSFAYSFLLYEDLKKVKDVTITQPI